MARRRVNRLAEEEQDLMQFEDRYKNRPRPKRDSADLVSGIVIRARGHHYDVQTDPTGDNRVRVCEVRGRLLAEQIAGLGGPGTTIVATVPGGGDPYANLPPLF